MNTDRPIVVIHSGVPQHDRILYDGLIEAFPNLRLRTSHRHDEILPNLRDAEVLIAWDFPFELLREAENLRWLQLLGAGVDKLRDLRVRDGQIVTNIRGVFGQEMAEYVLAYFLAHAKKLREFDRRQAERRWQPSDPSMLHGRTVGIAGLGSIGRVIASYCSALGMEVIGLKRSPGSVPGIRRVYVTSDIDAFLGQCDYLVLVMPGTPETEHLMNRERFARLKPGCFLVSIGRGSVMDEKALVEALKTGRIAGAALDVFTSEPLSGSNPLWYMDNVYVTPHVAGVNRPHDLLPAVRENVRRYLEDEPLLNPVDLERGY